MQITIKALTEGFIVARQDSPVQDPSTTACLTAEAALERVSQHLSLDYPNGVSVRTEPVKQEEPQKQEREEPQKQEQEEAPAKWSPGETVTAESLAAAKAWCAENGVELAKGMRCTTITRMIETHLGELADPPQAEEPAAPAAAEEPAPSTSGCPLCNDTGTLPNGAVCKHCKELNADTIRSAVNVVLESISTDLKDETRIAVMTVVSDSIRTKLKIRGLREAEDFGEAWEVVKAALVEAIAPETDETGGDDEWL